MKPQLKPSHFGYSRNIWVGLAIIVFTLWLFYQKQKRKNKD